MLATIESLLTCCYCNCNISSLILLQLQLPRHPGDYHRGPLICVALLVVDGPLKRPQNPDILTGARCAAPYFGVRTLKGLLFSGSEDYSEIRRHAGCPQPRFSAFDGPSYSAQHS